MTGTADVPSMPENVTALMTGIGRETTRQHAPTCAEVATMPGVTKSDKSSENTGFMRENAVNSIGHAGVAQW